VTIDAVIFRTQQERAADVRDFDWLVAGDSSGLTGLDAPELASRLGQRVELLSTMATVGPGGHALLVSRALERAANKPGVLLVVNAQGVSQSLEKFAPWEALLKNERRRPRLASIPSTARDWGFEAASTFAFHLPLPGNYGRHYGWPEDLASSVRANHGSMEDPNRLTKCQEDPITFKTSTAFKERLALFRDAIQRHPGVSLRLLISPSPATCTSPQFADQREQTLAELLEILAIERHAFIETPATFPIEEFATATHLNAKGRTKLTALVAEALAKPQ
jgi:hypothetical protein